MDSQNLYLAIELEHAPGAPAGNIPRLRLTRLTQYPLVTEVQIHLPDPFAMEDTQMVLCNFKGYQVVHKCAALATFRDESPCPRWGSVLTDMITFGFQDQILLMESLRLVIDRHSTFEAFLGANSPLRGKAFPRLSQRMPPALNSSPWIWIKDIGFMNWFEREAGMTVATRLAELQAQTRRDAYTEKLLKWATDPLSPTLEYVHANNTLPVSDLVPSLQGFLEPDVGTGCAARSCLESLSYFYPKNQFRMNPALVPVMLLIDPTPLSIQSKPFHYRDYADV